MADSDAVRMIPCDQFFQEFTNGDQTGWTAERAWLEEQHADELARLTASVVAEGIRDPIRVCDKDKRVIDGHHRAIVAQDLGLAMVPVANAWTCGWYPYMGEGGQWVDD